MIKRTYKVLTLIPLILFNLQVYAATQFPAEEEFVKTFSDQAINILNNEKISETEKTEVFTSLVMESIDLNLVSKFVLSKSWKNASDDQKARYLNAFETYFCWTRQEGQAF